VEKHKLIYLDGAMGTMLQKAGLKPGACPEMLNIRDPGAVTAVHRAYIEAGSGIIYANTFGANRYKLRGSGCQPAELIEAGVRCARTAAAGTDVLTALDIGPVGQLLEPYGPLPFREAYDVFREMLTAGERAGAELVVFETMTDLYEVKAAVLAAKENTSLPVFVTMTFERGGRTFTGCSVAAMAAVLDGLGVDAMGVNCSLGPEEIFPLAEELCALTDTPVIVKANAGLPDPATGRYSITAEAFAEAMLPYTAIGVSYIGGCCGTEPDYIRALAAVTGGETAVRRPVRRRSVVCTPTRVVEIDGVRVIGERINPTGKKRFRQAVLDGDMDFIVRQAAEQADAGAHILDVNVGVPGVDEAAVMERTVRAVQAVTDLPLQIDSSDTAALEAGLRAVNGKAIINSVNGERDKLEKVLPLAKKYGAAVVGLTMDENGIPATAEGRFAIAKRILDAAEAAGIPREDVFIDCLTLTVSAEQDKARETLRAVSMVRDSLGLHCVLGVSNVSFGLPERDLVTAGFLTLALAAGLDMPIVNPNTECVMDAVRVFNVLYGHDRNAEAYMAACAGRRRTEAAQAAIPGTPDGPGRALMDAVEKGLKEDCRRLTETLLRAGAEETEIIDGFLIPALDRVGNGFECGELFLPQLISAAGAASAAFELIRASIARRGAPSVSKGRLIVATVKGDIHDIGKNIVKTILENYGYTVIDLGRDVPPERVVRAAVEQDVRLVGLSALMTTTLGSMEETIRALRRSGHECKIWVGGAVMTPEYAEKIGADYYARDAKESVDIARRVLG